MQKNTEIQKRKWLFGSISLVFSFCSLVCFYFYRSLHWPLVLSRKDTLIWLLDVLHLSSFVFAVISLIFSIVAIIKGPKWYGAIAFLLALFAGWCSLIFF